MNWDQTMQKDALGLPRSANTSCMCYGLYELASRVYLGAKQLTIGPTDPINMNSDEGCSMACEVVVLLLL